MITSISSYGLLTGRYPGARMIDKLVANMFARNLTIAPQGMRAAVSQRGERVLARLCANGERGAALVEFALVIPMFVILTFGMCSFGLLFNQYLQLTEAVNIGGEQLAIARSNFADPCNVVAGDVEQVAPNLKASNMTFTFTLNGTAYGPSKTPTCTAGGTALVAAGPGVPVTLSVTYACAGALAFAFGNLAQFNPLPASSCNLQAQITEISQ